MEATKVESIIEISRILESRLLSLLNELSEIFPITKEKIQNLTREEFLLWDVLGVRFTKLLNYMGANLVDIVLIRLDEFSDNLSMIDKLNKLEKLGLIEDAHTWREMKKLGHSLAQEYPDHPELTAQFLNQAYTSSFELLKILNNILNKFEKSDKL